MSTNVFISYKKQLDIPKESNQNESSLSAIKRLEFVLNLLGLGFSAEFRKQNKIQANTDIVIDFLHPLLMSGLPASTLIALASATTIFREKGNIPILGMSPSTFYRLQKTPDERLTTAQTAYAFQFAELYTQALDVLGTKEAADNWLQAPARILSNQKPIDLITTQPGLQKVQQYLTQMDYGVYS